MNTIRLPAITRTERLEWGSTDWASESCLADWSTLERQWLGTEERAGGQRSTRLSPRKRFVASLFGAAAFAVVFIPSLQSALVSTAQALGPAAEWLGELLPHLGLGFGLLVLASVALGLWREPGEQAPSAPSQLDGAG